MSDSAPPRDAYYTREHEWLRIDGQTVTVGISAHAQEALGDIVFVSLPAVGTSVSAGSSFGEVESTKSVSDVYAPVSGEVSARNDALDATPELVNTDPYGEGWLIKVTLAPGESVDTGKFLDAAAYGEHAAGA